MRQQPAPCPLEHFDDLAWGFQFTSLRSNKLHTLGAGLADSRLQGQAASQPASQRWREPRQSSSFCRIRGLQLPSYGLCVEIVRF